MSNPDWYRTFFTELPNEFWRRAATPEWTVADVDFIVSRLGLAPGSRILDAPCGSGRHSLLLAARGHRVTGVDISPEAVTHARAAAATAGLDVDFTVGDMRDVPRTGAFDTALCLGNSFGYLDPAGTAQFVSALAGAVRPGGGLVIDFGATAESILPGFTGERDVMRTGDIEVETRTEYDLAESRLLSRYTFRRGDQVLETTAVHHIYTSGQLTGFLRAGGFTVTGRHASPDGAPYELGSPRLVLLARR
ncbi:SAM-dependent methyltransferase [Pseudofrankia asymbiotica]|uniref:Methyltransferase n=1 Tax=Pseudofrankia asymbiotica TaxID=1834516 RepID=A0A1V2I645_9ACTN|nr:class I SAM-dependent methyltransferase [Pseudofrankia asymbiotica]ONH25358.1 methyltransferase [Pseudofrankia asymbiotica]